MCNVKIQQYKYKPPKYIKNLVKLISNSDKLRKMKRYNETQLTVEIVCTLEHPFYADNLGWVEADK